MFIYYLYQQETCREIFIFYSQHIQTYVWGNSGLDNGNGFQYTGIPNITISGYNGDQRRYLRPPLL